MFSFTGAEQRTLLKLASGLKARLRAADAKPYQPLVGRTLSMIFQKRSTRTRVSAEGGFAQLGGHAIFLGACSAALRAMRRASRSSPGRSVAQLALRGR